MGDVGGPRAWPLPGLTGSRAALWSALVVLILLVSRLAFFPDGPWEQDEAIFAAGVVDTDVTRHRPHPPGFPGWMLIGKLLLPMVGDPLLALRVASALLSVAMVMWLAALLEPMARGWGTVAAVVVAFVPGVWVHAPRAFTTTPALAMFVLAAFCWRRKWNAAGWVALALGVAIRPQLLILAPLLVPLGIRRFPVRTWVPGVLLGALVGGATLAWVVQASGGWDAYVTSVRDHLGGHLETGAGAEVAPRDLGLFRAAGGLPGVMLLGMLWIVGVVELRRRRRLMIWSLAALPLVVAFVLGLHHPGFPRYAVPVFLVMAPGLARGLRVLGPQVGTGLAACVAGWSIGQSLPALLAMSANPLPPVVALRELAGGEGTLVYSHGQFAFVRLEEMTGRLRRAAVDASRAGSSPAGRYTTLGRPGDTLPGATVEHQVFAGLPPGTWDLSQRRYDRVHIVRDPVWIRSGALAPETDRLGQRFRWIGAEAELQPQPGAETLVLVIVLDEGAERGLITEVGGVRQGAPLREGVSVVEVALETCGEDCRVGLELRGDGDEARAARLYGAWCEGEGFQVAPFRVSAGRPQEARAHGVELEGVEAPESFTPERRPGAWTNGRARIDLPVTEGTLELVIAQPPPRGPTVEIVTGAGAHRVRAGAEPMTVRVPLGGSSTVELLSGTRTPASYSEDNPDERQLGAILFEVSWQPAPGGSSPASARPRPKLPQLEPVAAGLAVNLRGVSVPSASVAWVSGAGGTFGRTTDGGESWTTGVVPDAEALDFRDVEAFGSDRALLLSAGSPARVYLTRDGGQTWELTHENTDDRIFFDAMDFWDGHNGMAMGDPIDGRFQIIVTTDGGESWHALDQERLPVAVEGEAGFAGSGTAMRTGAGGRAWFGTGGTRARVFSFSLQPGVWQASETPVLATPSSGVFSVDFHGDLGVAVGGDYEREEAAESNLAISRDGGKTWEAGAGTLGGFREVVVFRPGHDGAQVVALGPSGLDVSLDGGRTWASRELAPAYHSLAFSPDGAVGWAVGGDGAVGRWVD